jgi:replicative DNA helicase
VSTSTLPPHNLDAEEGALGAAMISADAAALLVEQSQSSSFYRAKHQHIAAAIIALYGRGEPVDEITVTEELKRRSELETIGGSLVLHDLTSRVSTAASAEFHLAIVEGDAQLRRIIDATNRIQSRAYGASASDAGRVAEEAEATIYAASRSNATGSESSMAELLDDALATIEKGEGLVGHRSGFIDLDALTAGLHPTNLVLVAARPGVGKSALVLNVSRHLVASGVPVLFVSLEMSKKEVAMRLLCGEAGVSWEKVRAGPTTADWTRMTTAAETLYSFPLLYVSDAASATVVDLRAKARRYKAKHGLGCLVVDYLQLMTGERRDNRQQEVSEISRGLKLLAKELEIPVLAVSQLNRDSERRQNPRPQLSDLRDSGSLEQDADAVVFMHRKDEEQSETEIIVAKNRNGPTGKLKLTFLPHLTQFRNHAPDRPVGVP